MKLLVPVKRVIDYNVKARVRADGSRPCHAEESSESWIVVARRPDGGEGEYLPDDGAVGDAGKPGHRHRLAHQRQAPADRHQRQQVVAADGLHLDLRVPAERRQRPHQMIVDLLTQPFSARPSAPMAAPELLPDPWTDFRLI